MSQAITGNDPVAMLEQRIRYEQARYAELEVNLECKSWQLIADVLEAAIIVRDLCEADSDVKGPDYGHIMGASQREYDFYRVGSFDDRGREVLRSLSEAVERMEQQDDSQRKGP